MSYEKGANFNYGRCDWKMSYPKNRDEIKTADDDQLVKWWRFLSPANTKEKCILMGDITYEFKRRFKSTVTQS